MNPNGIPTQSPGLRGTSYPGKNVRRLATPKRVEAIGEIVLGSDVAATTPLEISAKVGKTKILEHGDSYFLGKRKLLATGFQIGGLLQRSPLGLVVFGSITQGSSFLATLGWRSQSLWD